MLPEFNSLKKLLEAFPDEQSCIDYLREIRWPNGVRCPYCGGVKVYAFKDGKWHKCATKDCAQRFSVRVKTIFEDSKLPLRTWFMAIWFITSHRKGIASTQLARNVGVTQKSAWFMLHRLRYAARTRSYNGPLTGEVEIDETYVGGKAKNRHADKRDGKAGAFGSGKTPVVGAVQRGGRTVALVTKDTSARTLQRFARAVVSTNADFIATDQAKGYMGLGRDFDHRVINHAAGQYTRGKTHTQTIESVWAILKRQIIGTHHFVSTKHLQAYVDEVSWRNTRNKSEEGQRFTQMVGDTGGRLTYKALIG